MRRWRSVPAAVVVGVVLSAGAGAGAASAPRVDVMVVGKGRTLLAAKTLTVRARTVSVGHRRCAVAAGTALAGLEAARRAHGPSYRLRDYGSCSRHAADAASLFVYKVAGESNRRTDGWVYKIGRRVPTTGAADPSGGKLHRGNHLTWFYCRMQHSGGCQRTLELTVTAARVAPGGPVGVLVRGYDDEGRGVLVAGARVSLGAAAAETGADGAATLAAPPASGRYRVGAQRTGLVPAFPVAVVVR